MVLRAVVIGAGWAGEGHTIGLRNAGVEVVAICGRTPESTHRRAEQLHIPHVRLDWRAALEEFHPDIAAIATPAPPHREMAEFAAQLGCHVMCEKPLALNVTDARAMLVAVERAGVKHAYAATGRYEPAVAQAQALVSQGMIGRLYEVESVVHLDFPVWGQPDHWQIQLEQGGGMLNNVFTHQLAQVLRVTQGSVHAVMGESRTLVERVPVGPAVHDLREWFGLGGQFDSTQVTEWRPVTGDLAYTVLARIALPDGEIANALFRGSFPGSTPYPSFEIYRGEKGSLYLTGGFSPQSRILHKASGRQTWDEIPVPPALRTALLTDNYVQGFWNLLMRDFVADIERGQNAGYLTFRDGCRDAEIIEIARSGRGWVWLTT